MTQEVKFKVYNPDKQLKKYLVAYKSEIVEHQQGFFSCRNIRYSVVSSIILEYKDYGINEPLIEIFKTTLNDNYYKLFRNTNKQVIDIQILGITKLC